MPEEAQRGVLSVEVVDRDGLREVALEVAARQRAQLTRQTYASVYRAFAAFVGSEATVMDVTAERVRAYRHLLEGAGRSPATVAKHIAALRCLAAAIGADVAIRDIRSARVYPGQPRALDQDQYARLLRMPDRRIPRGLRDVAVLMLLGRWAYDEARWRPC